MATVYAKMSTACSTKAQYSSDASDFSGGTWTDNSTLQAALTAAGASGVLHVLAGTYPATAVNATGGLDTTADNQSIVCHGRVYLAGAAFADHGVYVNHVGFKLNFGLGYPENAIVISGIPATKSAYFANKAADLQNIECINAYRGVTSAVGISTVEKFNINSVNQPFTCEVTGSALYASKGVIDGGVKNIFGNNAYGEFKNVIFAGIGESPITNTGSGVVIASNCEFLSCCATSSASLFQKTGAGSLTVKNSLITRNPYQSTKNIFGTGVTDGGGNVYASAKHVSPRRTGAVSIVVDDYTNATYAQDLAALAEEYGYRIGWAVDTANAAYEEFTPVDWTILQGLVDNGHEILSHTRHHVDMAIRDAIRIEYVGAGATATLTITDTAFQTHVDGVLDVNISFSDLFKDVNSSGYVDLGDIVVAVSADADYRCVIFNSVNTFVPASCLAEISGVDIKESVVDGATTYKYMCVLDPQKYYTEEVLGSISDIESNVSGASVRAMVYPRSTFDDTAISYIKNMVDGARGGTTGTNVSMSAAYNIYKIRGDNPQALIGTTSIARNIAYLASYLNHFGACLCLYAHKATEYSLENWEVIFQELKKSNLSVMTVSESIDFVRNGGTTSDSITYTSTESANPDYALMAISPCIGAGIDVGLTTDADGNAIPGAVGYDIGPYSYMPGWTLFDESMPALSLASTCPGKLLEVQEWSKPNITKKQIDKVSR